MTRTVWVLIAVLALGTSAFADAAAATRAHAVEAAKQIAAVDQRAGALIEFAAKLPS